MITDFNYNLVISYNLDEHPWTCL